MTHPCQYWQQSPNITAAYLNCGALIAFYLFRYSFLGSSSAPPALGDSTALQALLLQTTRLASLAAEEKKKKDEVSNELKVWLPRWGREIAFKSLTANARKKIWHFSLYSTGHRIFEEEAQVGVCARCLLAQFKSEGEEM